MKRVLGKKDCVESLTKTKMKVWLFPLKKRAKLSLFQTGKREKKEKKSKTFTVPNRKKGKESGSVSGKMD